MNCGNCGAPIKDGAAFCPSCGARQMAGASPQPTPYPSPYPQPTPYPSPYPQPSPYPSPQPPKKKKWVVPVVIALVAALLIGGGVFLFFALQDSDEDEKDASDTESGVTDDFDAEDDVWEDAFDTGRSGDPEEVLDNYFSAIQDGDTDAFMACFPKAYWDAMIEEEGYTEDELDDYIQTIITIASIGTFEYEILDEDSYSKSELEELNNDIGDEIGVEFTDAIEYDVSYDIELYGETETNEGLVTVAELDGRWYIID